MEEVTENNCGQCGKTSETKCARCKIIYYCGRECQRKHWRVHKKRCQTKLLETEPGEEVDDDEDEILPTEEMILKAKVAKSNIHGNGVFATKHIAQGERICFFYGQSIDANTKVRMRRLPDGLLSILNSDTLFHDTINKGKRLLGDGLFTQKLNNLS